MTALVSSKLTDDITVMELSFAKHSLLSVSRFHSNTTLSTGTIANSTGAGCKDLRIRFILYQLLQAVNFFHEKGLCLDSLDANSIMLDDEMWLYLPLGLSDRVVNCFTGVQAGIRSISSNQDSIARLATSVIPRPIDYYTPITIQWLSGKMSNFEYLMAVNFGAGRTMIDPLYHPILPWVTDFSSNCLDPCQASSSLRDLSMTKFRLSKGDTQLETTFKHSDPPHHVPESISELTYYIYMARRTPMQVLRRVVRDVFVPEHYPSSMGRIYEWTPDECIPEFFFDCSVFQSIHLQVGLQDLELPEFADTPEEFVRYHRAVLESDYVSENLHLWIDLTFGYCLQGDAAIAHMNVPLCHTLTSSERLGLDSPNVNKNPGFVVLFDRPHPQRQIHNDRMKAHIYSYQNTRGPSDSFVGLNPTLSVNNSSKYEATQLYSSFMAHEENPVKEYLSMDQSFRSPVASKLTQRPSVKEGTPQFAPMIAQGSAKESGANITDEMNRARRSRKSLMLPPGDSSLAKLKVLENVDLRNDPNIAKLVHNIQAQERHYKFSFRSGGNLDTSYTVEDVLQEARLAGISAEDGLNDESRGGLQEHRELWDREVVEIMEKVKGAMNAAKVKDNEKPNRYEMEDMFFIGCMVAELYTGRSLLQKNEILRIYSDGDIKELVAFVYSKTSGLPLVLRRLIVILLHPDPAIRPRAKEILTTCFLSSNEWYAGSVSIGKHRMSGSNDRREKLVEKLSKKTNYSDPQLVRMEMLQDLTYSLFPAYFRSVYDIISTVKMAPSKPGRLQALLSKLDAIYFLPLEGVNLVLFFLLEVLSDSSYFNEASFLEPNKPLLISLAARYWTAIDVLGIRLGVEATEKLLAVQVQKFISNFRNAELMPDLIESNIWSVLALRCGVKAFLRLFLPHLLTYMSAGVLQSMLEKGNSKTSGPDGSSAAVEPNAPLWSLPEWNNKAHWLRKVPLQTLQTLQQAAATSIVSLCDPDSLGRGITSRYILPSLLSLVGNPQLAAAAFDIGADRDTALPLHFARSIRKALVSSDGLVDDDLTESDHALASSADEVTTTADSSNINSEELEAYLIDKSQINTQEMYVVNAIVRSGMKLGEEVTAELIVAHIMNVTLPDLETQLNLTPKHGTSAAILEVIVLINGLLPALSPATILHHLLLPARISGCSIPRLLAHWPLSLAWSFLDDIEDYAMADATQIAVSIENVRMFTVLHEVCRLVVSTSMMVGAEICAEFVLPSVDVFFHNFVETYGMIPVESKSMLKAFELGSELFLPLIQLMGAEAFQTGVPNVNPRLELWLNAIGSHIPLRCPPLPSNIWPEVTSETANRPERKKSIMQWISGKVSSLTSSGTAAPSGNVGASTQSVAGSMTPIAHNAGNALHHRTSITSTIDSIPSSTAKKSSVRKPSRPDITADLPPNATPQTQPRTAQQLAHRMMLATPGGVAKGSASAGAGGNGTGQVQSAFSSTYGTELRSFEAPTPVSNNQALTSSGSSSLVTSPADGHVVSKPSVVVSSQQINDDDHSQTTALETSVQIESPADESALSTRLRLEQTVVSPGSDDNNSAKTNGSPPTMGSGDQDYVPDSDDEVGAPPVSVANTSSSRINTPRNQGQSDVQLQQTIVDEADGGDNSETVAIAEAVPVSSASSTLLLEAVAVTVADDDDNRSDADLNNLDVVTGEGEVVSPSSHLLLSDTSEKQESSPLPESSTAVTNDEHITFAPSGGDSPLSPSFMGLNDDDTQGATYDSDHSGIFATQHNNHGRKLTVSEKRNPFLTYRKLMAGRSSKTTRATLQQMSAANMMLKSPKLTKKGSKVSSLLGGGSSTDHYYHHPHHGHGHNDSQEDIESREWFHNALVWLLAGQGRWCVDKEVLDRSHRDHHKLLRSATHHHHYSNPNARQVTGVYYATNHDWNPAAQISLTVPKIAVDVASDAGSLIHFQLQANTQWRLEEAPGNIRCMATNAAETLLMTCSRSGVRIWSLTSHPLSHISNYTQHASAPFQGAFVRDGQHAVTCDGSIHLWDVEHHVPLSIITNTDKSNGFSSFHMVPSKLGVHASIDGMGDEQLLATVQDSICYYDIRCSHQRALYKVADWVLPPIPPLPGTLYNSSIEPLHLTCAASHEHYVYAGSLTGGVWILDRRMGRVLQSWQAHDGPVIKVLPSKQIIFSVPTSSYHFSCMYLDPSFQRSPFHVGDGSRSRCVGILR